MQTLQANLETSTGIAPSVIDDVMLDLEIHVSKKANIILNGILSLSPRVYAGIVTRLLKDELGINSTAIKSNSLGRPLANPFMLLATSFNAVAHVEI